MALLDVSKINLTFGGINVINSLSFSVQEQMIVSLIGPNGAGKTSVFNCLSGFYRPDGGDITFDGHSIMRRKPYKITRRGMARTFQNLRLFKNMTVLENVMSGMHCRTSAGVAGALFRLNSQKQEEKQILKVSEDCLEFVGILNSKNRYAGDLPYGDQRRVDWARALATRPRLILFDEPAAGLNYDEKEQLVHLIRRIRNELGIAILLIEHDMGLVMKISEWIYVIDYGHKIAEGSADEIKNNPRVIEAYLGKDENEAS